MRPLIFCLLVLLSPLTVRASDLANVDLADGRRYLGAAPEGIANPPLVIALHGGGGSPEQFSRDSGLAPAALDAGFAIVFPSGTSRRAVGPKVWNAGYCCGYAPAAGIDDQAFLTLVIKDAIRRYHVDPSRIYITGMSNGAILAET
ncbi:MAG: PHB depolymerase family esterase, partial [Paracoccaceae bacterium]